MAGPESPSAAASVRIGAYRLEVSGGAGSFAQFDGDEEDENARELAAALDEPERPPAGVAAIEEFEETADEVTSRIEDADKYLRAAAAGELLDLDNLTGEIDSLLDLCARLDKQGRFDEQLKLMRSLNGLLALCLRWWDLIRSLRRLLRSATAAKHVPAQAFAHHELGSLHLCAGQPAEAAEHLGKALRLEDVMGDLAGRCATRHNLDSSHRDLAMRSGGGVPPPRRIQRLVILAGALAIAGGSGAGLALAIHGGGGGGGTASHATLIVHKDFVPNAPAATATISVICTNGGRPDGSPKTATEAAPAVFKISGLAAGATCTASEEKAPANYSKVQADCRDVPVAIGERSSCTIINHRKGLATATLTVRTDFTPNAPDASIGVTVTCTKGGRPDNAQKRVTEATPVDFRITRFGNGATCTATGTQPAGYSQRNLDCRNVPITLGASAPCTIVNTRGSSTSALFKVTKDFSDDNPAKVSISLSCDSGTISKRPIDAAEGSPATFTVTGFQAGARCTASEDTPLSGYRLDESRCQGVPIARGGCTIVNTLNTTQLTVRKDYTDSNTDEVLVNLDCTGGKVVEPRLKASPSSPAVFTITGFDASTACTATEVHFSGTYDRDESDCKDVTIVSRGECTLVNSPVGGTG